MPIARKYSILLWIAQVLVAAMFLFAGGMKLVSPIEMLRGPVALPDAFIRFIGVAEVLGAVGLILPGLLRIKQALTPIAAVGLVTIMTGAVTITIEGGMGAAAVMPLVIGVLAATIAYGRRGWAPAALAIPRPVVRQTAAA